MDPVSQVALGAAAAGAFCPKRNLRAALLVGGLAGAAPDLDIFIRSADDPLLGLQFHRHFTHALIVAPVVGAVVAWLAHLIFFRRSHTTRELLPFGIVGALTHGPLDACTSYGTLLYWPFSLHRESWDTISVIDPLFTVPLVVLLAVAAILRRPALPRIACVWCLGYLSLGLVQRERAQSFAENLALERRHQPVDLTARPSSGNIVLWRTVYRNGGIYHVDAVNLFPGREPVHYPGSQADVFQMDEATGIAIRDSTLETDIERFRFFSQGFLYRYPGDPMVIADLRYSLLPDSILPLWGIRIDPSEPSEHVEFETFRDASAGNAWKLWRMIRGGDIPSDSVSSDPDSGN